MFAACLGVRSGFPFSFLQRSSAFSRRQRSFSSSRSQNAAPSGRGFVESRVVRVRGGEGGRGRVFFKKHSLHCLTGPGEPLGGEGGAGGCVLLKVDKRKGAREADLRHLPGSLSAGAGGVGFRDGQRGKKGQDAVLALPPGCVVWELLLSQGTGEAGSRIESLNHEQQQAVEAALPEDLTSLSDQDFQDFVVDEEERRRRRLCVSSHWRRRFLCEVGIPSLGGSLAGTSPKVASAAQAAGRSAISLEVSRRLVGPVEEVVVAEGGRGGGGNTRASPHGAEEGAAGEERLLLVSRLWQSDVALLGTPNAGKTQLLARLTRSACRPAPWANATQHPQAGKLLLLKEGTPLAADGSGSSLCVLDLPGLGAEKEGGPSLLGLQTSAAQEERVLRALEGVQLVALVLDAASAGEEGDASCLSAVAKGLAEKLLRRSPLLAAKPFLCICTKCDVWPSETLRKVDDFWRDSQRLFRTQRAQVEEALQSFLTELEPRLGCSAQRELLRQLRSQVQWEDVPEVVPISAKENMGMHRLVLVLQQLLQRTERLREALMQLQRLAWRAED